MHSPKGQYLTKIEKLKSCAAELEALGPDTEREFLSIGEMLNNLSSLCFQMTDCAVQIASISNFNTENTTANNYSFTDETRKIFKNVTKQVKDSIDSLGEGGDLLLELSDRIRTLREPIKKLYTLGKTFRVLGISIKIESSRNEDASHGFKLLADEVAEIAMLVQDNCRYCTEKTNIIDRDIHSSRQDLSNKKNQYDNKAEQAIYNILGTLEEIGDKSEALASGIQERSSAMVQGISDVVMAMQFHDITRQQLENVAKALFEICDKVKKNEADSGVDNENDVLEIYGILSIQTAHLNSIFEQIVQAKKQIELGLGKTMEQARSQAEDVRTLLSMKDSTGSKSVIASLEKEINNIVHSLNKALNVVKHAAEVSKNVYDNVSDIGSFVSKIENISFDVKTLAINAMIEATKTGDTGRTLIVLAKELSILSMETKNGAEDSIEMLNRIMAGTEKQLELSTNLDKTRAEVDEMINRAKVLTGTILSSMVNLGELAHKIDSDNRDLESRIVRLVPSIKFPEIMGDRIDRNWQMICQVINDIEEQYPQFLEKDSKVEQIMEKLSRQYVMDRERTIHAQVAGLEQIEHTDDSGEIELFGDNDTELDETWTDDKQDEEGLGDNVELF
jgi:methyl-accepting chemotaxis protein